MSQKSLELVARAFAAFSEGGVEDSIEFFAEDVAWTTADLPGIEQVHGHDGLRTLAREMQDNFDDFSLELTDLERSGSRVLAAVHQTGTGRLSGVEVELNYWFVNELRDGQIARVEAYLDEREAREAAGLGEGRP